jgi:hypothetical protein
VPIPAEAAVAVVLEDERNGCKNLSFQGGFFLYQAESEF